MKITYQRKRYEPGNVKDFKGTVVNIITLKEIYHQNPNQSEFQKVMNNLKKIIYNNNKCQKNLKRSF